MAVYSVWHADLVGHIYNANVRIFVDVPKIVQIIPGPIRPIFVRSRRPCQPAPPWDYRPLGDAVKWTMNATLAHCKRPCVHKIPDFAFMSFKIFWHSVLMPSTHASIIVGLCICCGCMEPTTIASGRSHRADAKQARPDRHKQALQRVLEPVHSADPPLYSSLTPSPWEPSAEM